MALQWRDIHNLTTFLVPIFKLRWTEGVCYLKGAGEVRGDWREEYWSKGFQDLIIRGGAFIHSSGVSITEVLVQLGMLVQHIKNKGWGKVRLERREWAVRAEVIKGRLEYNTHTHTKLGQDQWFRTKSMNSKREAESSFHVTPSVWPWCENEGLQQSLRTEAKHFYNVGSSYSTYHRANIHYKY